MIIRKPYAFLIRHFKLIHIVLGVLIAYLTYETTQLIGFFRDFVESSKLPVANGLAGYFINFFMYFAVLGVLAITIIVYILLYRKKKQTRMYAVVIGYYILFFILLTVSFNILATIEKEITSGEAARLYRDISLIAYLPQYFFMFFMFFRGIGFDLKKFNFSADMIQIEIEEKDAEEIEVVVPKDTYKLQRFIRRFIREFRYYVLENTFLFICLCVIVVSIIGTAIFMNVKVYNEKVRVGQDFAYKGFTLTYLDSIVTNLNSKGEVLVEGKYYLVVAFNVKSNTSSIIDWKDFRLLAGKDIIYPTYTKREHFVDYGNPYQGEKLTRGWDSDYIFIFELDKNLVMGSYNLRIVNKLTFNVGQIEPSYKDVKLKPTKIDKITKDSTVELGSELNLKKTTLNASKLTVKDYEIANRYIYSYEYCDPLNKEDCRSFQYPVSVDAASTARKTLLILDYDLVLADSYYKMSLKNKHIRDFFFTFGRIRYTVNGKEKIVSVTDKTPEQATNTVVMQVDSDIKGADKIELIITIRNIQNIIVLK